MGRALTNKDTIVLADFVNTTGDQVFDGTLRQGLSVQLEQSPFLSLVSEDRIQQVLPLMGQPADAPLTAKVAREICERTASAAVLEGSIASLGSQYVLGLSAKNCRTGEVLDEEQVQAAKKRGRPEFPESNCQQIQKPNRRIACHSRKARSISIRKLPSGMPFLLPTMRTLTSWGNPRTPFSELPNANWKSPIY